MIEVGQTAPDFNLQDQAGSQQSLSDLKGQHSLIYFYPKDDTPGCTVQACSLRDNFEDLKADSITVYGVSADDMASHKKFAEKYKLPFPVLSDPSKEMIKAYGAWGKKSMYGRSFEGIVRSAVLIGPDLKIEAHWPKIAPLKTVGEVKKFMAEHSH